MPEEYWGHSANDRGAGIPEFLRDHLVGTAKRAGEFGEKLGIRSLAGAAGMLHDLGKYADQMQHRLRGKSELGRDHWSIGAYAALCKFQRRGSDAIAIAAAIEGHHAGLPMPRDLATYAEKLNKLFESEPSRFTDVDIGTLLSRFKSDGLEIPRLNRDESLESESHTASRMLDIRMLFSCLVDADFLETEGHFNGDGTTPRRERDSAPIMDFARALGLVEAEADRLQSAAKGDPGLQAVRRRLFSSCLRSGRDQPIGLFTLEAPTGTGKTLALLAFALAHAVEHGLDRIIIILPFLNILDQTVQTYRDVLCGEGKFGEECILEDHSLADWTNRRDDKSGPGDAAKLDDPERLRRLLAENWDAPIVLTTSVKCLESLHGDRPSSCRKLHHMARNVIVFDEVQSIPIDLIVPTLATLSRLSQRFGSSIVFATATQPAFTHLDDKVKSLCSSGWAPRPLIDFAGELFEQTSRRTRVSWRIDEPTSWEDLASELARDENRQVLCIVNLKRHATRVLKLLEQTKAEGLLHLSTQMCPCHRAAVLKRVERWLAAGKPVRLIATQCIEAGVDLSFPRVFRALGPLEAIAQAAGRCNRHCELASVGDVVVFHPEDEKVLYPPGGYKAAAAATMTLLRKLGMLDDQRVIDDPKRIAEYYRLLYDLKEGSLTKPSLVNALERLDFACVAKEYRLIDQRQINVLVPYCVETFDTLVAAIDSDSREGKPPGFYREWIRKARPLTVGVYPEQLTDALQSRLCPIFFGRAHDRPYLDADWFYCLDRDLYDRKLLGLKMDVEFKSCF